eukprot:scaffold119463_cov66-Phaeocystis_antarctica.AAC.2
MSQVDHLGASAPQPRLLERYLRHLRLDGHCEVARAHRRADLIDARPRGKRRVLETAGAVV